MIDYVEKYGLLNHLNDNNVNFRISDNKKIFESDKADGIGRDKSKVVSVALDVSFIATCPKTITRSPILK